MYRIQNQTDGYCEIVLYDLIYQGYTANKILDQLKGVTGLKGITLRINSDGGEVFEALSIYNYINSLNIPVRVFVDGIAASAASILACLGTCFMAENAMLMLHNPFAWVEGDSEDMRSMADVLDKVRDSIVSVYTAKTGKSADEIKELMSAETWVSASEAKELGFCDELVSVKREENVNAQVDGTVAANIRKQERERLQALDSLMTPERKSIINRAKYETLQRAEDIALELLNIQARHEDNWETDGISPGSVKADRTQEIADMINRKRGY